MEISELTKQLLAAKEEKGLTFEQISKKIDLAESLVAALFYGQFRVEEDKAKKLCAELGLGKEVEKFLVEWPDRGLGPVVPTDPVIYRLYEIVLVYGYPIKALIHEKFGDGIMSAIDYTLDVERVEDPKGDRVKLTMNGKFLPYKVY
jgi:cyanate lyase